MGPIGRSTSLIYVDLDAFKSINDTYGHAAGDDVLCEFAQVLRSEIRCEDIPCRTGGEEFCVVLPHATRDEATRVADRIVNAMRAKREGRDRVIVGDVACASA